MGAASLFKKTININCTSCLIHSMLALVVGCLTNSTAKAQHICDTLGLQIIEEQINQENVQPGGFDPSMMFFVLGCDEPGSLDTIQDTDADMQPLPVKPGNSSTTPGSGGGTVSYSCINTSGNYEEIKSTTTCTRCARKIPCQQCCQHLAPSQAAADQCKLGCAGHPGGSAH